MHAGMKEKQDRPDTNRERTSDVTHVTIQSSIGAGLYGEDVTILDSFVCVRTSVIRRGKSAEPLIFYLYTFCSPERDPCPECACYANSSVVPRTHDPDMIVAPRTRNPDM